MRQADILEGGCVETKKLAEHRGRVHKLAIEPGSSRMFMSCGEDGLIRRVSAVVLFIFMFSLIFF